MEFSVRKEFIGRDSFLEGLPQNTQRVDCSCNEVTHPSNAVDEFHHVFS